MTLRYAAALIVVLTVGCVCERRAVTIFRPARPEAPVVTVLSGSVAHPTSHNR